MARLVLIALAASAAAAVPVSAQPGPGPDGYGPPPADMGPPPPPGVTWRERAPASRVGFISEPPRTIVVAPQVRTRTWTGEGAPPPPRMIIMHGNDGPPPPPHMGEMHGQDGRMVRRRIEIRRMGPDYGPPIGPGYGPPMGGGYGYMQGAPMMPPPPPCPCGPAPMPYGYSYGGGGAVIVTETTVTERPMVQRRVWYTTVRERVHVAPRRVHRVYRTKLIKARPQPGERG